jgi:hypothetical protein
MTGMKSLMLGAALVAGMAGLSAAPAHAAQFGVYIGAPVAYVPPSPGPGYFWVAGYYDGGYWVPGRWEFRGVVDRDDYYRRHDFDRDRFYDRDDRYRDRDGYRGRDGYRDHDDHDRR